MQHVGENTEIEHNNSKAYASIEQLHQKEQVLKHKNRTTCSWYEK